MLGVDGYPQLFISVPPGSSMPRVLALLIALATLAILAPRPTHAAGAAALAPDPFATEVLELLNHERIAAGAAPVQRAVLIEEIAARRALEMATLGYFSHYGPDGSSALTLLHEAGIGYQAAGENIARSNYDAREVVRAIHHAWMASEGHRANMLDPRYQQAGIGVAVVDGVYYLAVVFVG
jgi:uncharacterized protein YkwD